MRAVGPGRSLIGRRDRKATIHAHVMSAAIAQMAEIVPGGIRIRSHYSPARQHAPPPESESDRLVREAMQQVTRGNQLTVPATLHFQHLR